MAENRDNKNRRDKKPRDKRNRGNEDVRREHPQPSRPEELFREKKRQYERLMEEYRTYAKKAKEIREKALELIREEPPIEEGEVRGEMIRTRGGRTTQTPAIIVRGRGKKGRIIQAKEMPP